MWLTMELPINASDSVHYSQINKFLAFVRIKLYPSILCSGAFCIAFWPVFVLPILLPQVIISLNFV